MESIEELSTKVKNLEQEVNRLKQKRTYQGDVVPAAIKNRHLGEANSFVYFGLSADRPTEGTIINPFSTSMYFAIDTGVLSIWTTTGWLSETFT